MEGIGLKRGVLPNSYKSSDQVLMVFMVFLLISSFLLSFSSQFMPF